MQHQNIKYKTAVKTGSLLKALIEKSTKFKKRYCISKLREYIFSETFSKVFILYGLQGTGKKTMMYQILTEFNDTEFNKAAFIQVSKTNCITDLFEDLKKLEENGFKYVFIDEVTLMDDFIEGAAILSDIYAASGMKIILSGTDSLGFAITKGEQLYDRCIMCHTTFIPYRDFEEVLGIKGIDEYIRYGGTMSLSVVNYNTESIFTNERRTNKYLDIAIAQNIQHSLEMYEYGGHFRSLEDVYEKGELTDFIIKVIENINHSFTKEIKDIKEIIKNEEQSVVIEEGKLLQIKEYLTLLDLINDIDVETLPDITKKNKMTVTMIPGMRYLQAKVFIENLVSEKVVTLIPKERLSIVDKLLSEVRAKMMEEIIFLDTKIAKPDKKVFKLKFKGGEYNMVVYDKYSLTCEIYEIKYSTELDSHLFLNINNEDKCNMIEHRYGKIIEKYVIYKGSNIEVNGLKYLNVQEYLKSLHV